MVAADDIGCGAIVKEFLPSVGAMAFRKRLCSPTEGPYPGQTMSYPRVPGNASPALGADGWGGLKRARHRPSSRVEGVHGRGGRHRLRGPIPRADALPLQTHRACALYGQAL